MSSSDRDRDRKNANSLLKQRFRGRHRRGILNSLMMTTTTTTTMMMMMMMVGDGGELMVMVNQIFKLLLLTQYTKQIMLLRSHKLRLIGCKILFCLYFCLFCTLATKSKNARLNYVTRVVLYCILP